ncbi:MAG: tetratricopeptide repeat protein [Rhabdochlamydiaceae bacterium]
MYIVPLLVCLFFFSSCTLKHSRIEPQFSPTVQDSYVKSLASSFPPLSEEEKQTPWGIEFVIGQKFARDLDLYQAITAFKRSDILIPSELSHRKKELFYNIVLSYYLGQKYQDLIYFYEKSKMADHLIDLNIWEDFLTILYDSYSKVGDKGQTKRFIDYLNQNHPHLAQKLHLHHSIEMADLTDLTTLSKASVPLQQALHSYQIHKKSPFKAKSLNALLPGAGYLYLGQKQSALTAFLLNGAFIAAAYQFYHKGYIAAGVITTSFEAGWYFGGILGAEIETKVYNERVYESCFYPFMYQEKVFPILQLKYGF